MSLVRLKFVGADTRPMPPTALTARQSKRPGLFASRILRAYGFGVHPGTRKARRLVWAPLSDTTTPGIMRPPVEHRRGRRLNGRERAELADILRREFLLLGDFVLASGRRTTYYFDCKLTTYSEPRKLELAAVRILDQIRPRSGGGSRPSAD